MGNTLNKLAIGKVTGKASGAVTTIATSTQDPVDLVITIDSPSYVTSLRGNDIFKVTPTGASTKFMTAQSGSMAVFEEVRDKKMLYIGTFMSLGLIKMGVVILGD